MASKDFIRNPTSKSFASRAGGFPKIPPISINNFQATAEYLLQYDLPVKADHTGNKCLWLLAHNKNSEQVITVKRTKTEHAIEQRFWAYLSLSKDEADPATAFTIWDSKPKILAKTSRKEPNRDPKRLPILEMIKIVADQSDPPEVESTTGEITASGSYNNNNRKVKITNKGASAVFQVSKNGEVRFELGT